MPLLHLLIALGIVCAVVILANMYVPTGRVRTVLNVVLALIIVGMGLWAINTYVPMAGSINAILNIVVVIATIVFVLQAVGLWEKLIAASKRLFARAKQAEARAEAHHEEERRNEERRKDEQAKQPPAPQQPQAQQPPAQQPSH